MQTAVVAFDNPVCNGQAEASALVPGLSPLSASIFYSELPKAQDQPSATIAA